MRFENSAPQRFGIKPRDLDDFRRAGEPAHDANGSRWNVGNVSEETNNRGVSFAIHRRRGHVKFPDVTQLPGELCLARPRTNLKRESGFHGQLSAIRSALADR